MWCTVFSTYILLTRLKHIQLLCSQMYGVKEKISHLKISLWQVDSFKPKKTKAQNTQEETLTFPLSAWRIYTEELFQEGSYHQRYL